MNWIEQYYWHIQNGSTLNAILQGCAIGWGAVFFWRLFA